MMSFREVNQEDGTIEVEIGERKLVCPVCAGSRFHERNSLLNTRAATFFHFD